MLYRSVMNRYTAFILFIFGLTPYSIAQQSNTLFLMHSIPQSNFVNPAVMERCKWFIGLPVLNSIHADVGITAVSFKQVFYKEGNTYFLNNEEEIVSRLQKTDVVSAELNVSLLNLGYRYKNSYVTFGINEKANAWTVLPKDGVELFVFGNGKFEGKTADLSQLGGFLNYYREYFLGLAQKKGDDLTLGVRAKLLFGKMNLYSVNNQASLYTDDVTFDWTIVSDLGIDLSGPFIVDTAGNASISIDQNADIMSILFENSNLGLGLDGGFLYDYNDKLTLHGSFIDLGFISWKASTQQYDEQSTYTFRGFDDTNYNTGYVDSIFNDFLDQMNYTSSTSSYSHWLPLQTFIGATYQMWPKTSIGLINHNTYYRHRTKSSFTLSLNANPYKWLTASLSYSYLNGAWNNVGLGLGARSNNFQFYAVTDNLLAAFIPLSARDVNLRFGMNLFFGCRNKTEQDDIDTSCAGCYWLQQQEEKNQKLYKKGKINPH